MAAKRHRPLTRRRCKSYRCPVIPWIELDTAPVPSSAGRLRLLRRDTEYLIMAGATPLMNSRQRGSEEDLSRLSIEAMGSRPAPRVLIGGLGMGFTLRAALAGLPPNASVVVAELVPAVVAWARGHMAPVFGTSLDDPRVDIRVTDVTRAISAGPLWDAILLDVDNGPDGLTRDSNNGLYTVAGLRRSRTALHPGGVLAVWSSAPDDRFTRRVQAAGFGVAEHRVRARANGKGPRHHIWIATALAAPKR